MLKSSNLSSLC